MELLPGSGSVWGALLLTTLAGAATAAGAGAAFFTRRTNTRFLSVALGLSGGVMIYISFVELLAGANTALREAFGGRTGAFAAMAAFFGGMLAAGIIDRLVPEPVNPHETKSLEEMNGQAPPDSAKLHRAGIRFAAAIAIHKFPEGLAVFAASLTGLELGIPVALAMALHNIPEGIAVSVPVYYATGSRAKAFWYASLTGLADPAGALLGYLVLAPFLTGTLLEIIYAAVAGVMVFVTFDGLLPMAHKYGEEHWSLYGLVAGMFLMAAGLAII
ncbi:zinc transporter ZupT [uncultured Victivallis sp.]|uniref:zinc transporter ZupT n=1 Tax=uncultured Victivallis sp. TaxID=354118 RepID=UPI0025F4C231|nr:zinc transporter ZupT [uncultured Victivallis sp.]